MPRHIFLYDPPDRLVIGTVGQPGERTFFMQARSAGQLTSVVLEKTQVAALAERLDQLLDEVLRASGGTSSVPAVAPLELNDTLPLDQPIVEDVVTTGLYSHKAHAAVERAGGQVIAAAALVDRSAGEVDLGVPFFPLVELSVPSYAEDELPPELAAIPVEKPGSRK